MQRLLQHNNEDYEAYLDRAHYFQRRALVETDAQKQRAIRDEAELDTRKAYQLAPGKLDTLLAAGSLDEKAALEWAGLILAGNARRLYQL